jgi:hypothetical protein
MPLRFRRRLNIAPGFSLNLGKRGASLSLGRRGAHVTLGHGQMRETVGLPGTGLSYTQTQGRRRRRPKRSGGIGAALLGLFVLYVLIRMALHAAGIIG